MKVALIGPELEENLGLGYLCSSIEAHGHTAGIFDFHSPAQIPAIVAQVLRVKPQVLGLSMVFTSRAREFIRLAQAARQAGFTGHITAGGHFASFNARELLNRFDFFDSIVHGEGEEGIVDLINNLSQPQSVSGITCRDQSGKVITTSPRPNPPDLDCRPFPTRPASFQEYLGLPIANILGSRGCYGKCRYCSITAWYRQNQGKRFRQRNVQKIAAEMAQLYNERGVRIFNFHDDNFFMPKTSDTVDRFTALQRYLHTQGLGKIAIQVKARPDSIHREPISVLKQMGLFRVFLGIESNAPAGLKTLGRGATTHQNHKALQILSDFDLHVTFNLLIFDPETIVTDIRENISFMRQYSHMPLNFARTEVYSGTPLESILRRQKRLQGNMFGYSYDICDRHAQQAFEMFTQIFLPRNFDADGMNLQAMKLDYYLYLLKHFYPNRASPELIRNVKSLICKLNNNSADLLAQICDFVTTPHTHSEAACDTFAKNLALAREHFDKKLKYQTRTLSARLTNAPCIPKPSAKPSAAVAASAAAALMLTAFGCDKSAKEPVSPDLQKPPQQNISQLRELSAQEVVAINENINETYQRDFDHLVEKHGITRSLPVTQVTIHLNLDQQGKVTSCDVTVPKNTFDQSFEKELTNQIKQWVFPFINEQGRCTVVLTYGTPPYWHMCEMAPMPTKPDPSPATKQ